MDQTLVCGLSCFQVDSTDKHRAYDQPDRMTASDDPSWMQYMAQLNWYRSPRRCPCDICRRCRGEPPLPPSAYARPEQIEYVEMNTDNNETDGDDDDLPELIQMEPPARDQGALGLNFSRTPVLPEIRAPSVLESDWETVNSSLDIASKLGHLPLLMSVANEFMNKAFCHRIPH